LYTKVLLFPGKNKFLDVAIFMPIVFSAFLCRLRGTPRSTACPFFAWDSRRKAAFF